MPVAVDAQWCSWRGGQLHGIGASVKLPSVWTEELGTRWRVNVPGRGNSSPIIWGDYVFLTSIVQTENGEQAAVISIDRTTGETRWQQAIGTPSGASHSKNGFASSTPATDGQRAYASFGAQGLFAFDFSGKLLWHAAFPQQHHEWERPPARLFLNSR